MAFCKKAVLLGFLALVLVVSPPVFGKLFVGVSLGTFTVRERIKCDVFSRCDFKFYICIDHVLSSNKLTGCTYKSITTKTYYNHYGPLNLANELGSLIIIPMDTWRGGIHLKIQVQDYDHVSKSDAVDFFSAKYYGPIGNRVYVRLNSRTSIPVTFTSSCYEYYYGPRCETFCQFRLGYYKCNPMTGAKICLSGWTGSQCNIRITTTSTTTSTTPTTTTTTSTTTTTTPATTKTTPTTTTTTPTTTTTTPTTTTTTPTTILTTTTSSSITSPLNNVSTTRTEEHTVTMSSVTVLWNVSSLLINTSVIQSNTSNCNISSDGDDLYEEVSFSNSSMNNSTAVNSSRSNNFDSVEAAITSLDRKHWMCGDVFLSSSNLSQTSEEDVLLNLISVVHTALSSVGNYSLNISLSGIQCEMMLESYVKLEYCIEDLNQDIVVLDLLKQELSYNLSNWNMIQRPQCSSHNSLMIPAVVASVLVTVGISTIFVVVFYRKRKQRSMDIKKYDFACKFRDADQRDATLGTEELINILDE